MIKILGKITSKNYEQKYPNYYEFFNALYCYEKQKYKQTYKVMDDQ